MGGIYEVAVEMGSSAMTYVPSFIQIGSSIQKLMGGIDTHTGWESHWPTFIFLIRREGKKNLANIAENTLRKVLTKHSA
jgi:hypothetical protein